MNASVEQTRTGQALYLALRNEGRKNALSRALLTDLIAALRNAAEDDGIRVIFIQGHGGLFSAGADINDLTGTDADIGYDALTTEAAAMIREQAVPVIALVEAYCLGAAVEIALACDLCIAKAGAFLQVPATRIGLLYKPGSIAALKGKYSYDALFRLMVLAERILADEAHRLGFFSGVVDDLKTRAAGITELIEQTDTTAAAATRRALLASETDDGEMDALNRKYRDLMSSEDRRRGLEALKARLAGGKQS